MGGNAANETDARWRRQWNHRKAKLEDRRKEMARKKGIRTKTWEDKRARKGERKKLAQDQWRIEKRQEKARKGRKASASPHGTHTEEDPMAYGLQGAISPKNKRRREKDRIKRRERKDSKKGSRMEKGQGRSHTG